MNKREIENVVKEIMINDGPDGHCDGSDVITDFIEALLDGNGAEWKQKYYKTNDITSYSVERCPKCESYNTGELWSEKDNDLAFVCYSCKHEWKSTTN